MLNAEQKLWLVCQVHGDILQYQAAEVTLTDRSRLTFHVSRAFYSFNSVSTGFATLGITGCI
jgi:hypothetical protein